MKYLFSFSIIIILSFSFASCSTNSIQDTSALSTAKGNSATGNTAIVYIKRADLNFFDKPEVLINGEYLGILKRGTTMRIELPPGKKLMQIGCEIKNTKCDNFNFYVEAGRTYRYKTNFWYGFIVERDL